MKSDLRKISDQIGRELFLKETPQRIISLVPSITELLYDLKLDEHVVGITKFCIHPSAWFKSKTRVGGTKNPNLDRIQALNPDLIIANKEENRKPDIEQLSKFFPVWVSDVNDIQQAFELIVSIGDITNKKVYAEQMLTELKASFFDINLKAQNISIAYIIWKEPWMSVSKQTFIHSMLNLCGFQNVFSNAGERYPETSIEELKLLKPEYIFLSSEPFPFNEKHVIELKKQLTHSKIILVDGEIFSWYGSRLLKAKNYFEKILEPQLRN